MLLLGMELLNDFHVTKSLYISLHQFAICIQSRLIGEPPTIEVKVRQSNHSPSSYKAQTKIAHTFNPQTSNLSTPHSPLTLPLLSSPTSTPLTHPYKTTSPPVASAINPALAAKSPTRPPVPRISKIG